jgi:Ran GTPase-activating protein (RanGAP) involved in mRNA processing and transport
LEQELAGALHHNSSLLHIGLSSNRIGEEGAKHLASVLMLNRALETLYLEGLFLPIY